jgi:enoyl-CoA hydratase/carnithine racemase
MNGITPDVVAGINKACDEILSDESLRALVITGASNAGLEDKMESFSVGMDIDFLKKCFADVEGVFFPFLTSMHQLCLRLESLPVPVIAAVNGFARAGGFELLLAADLVVIAEEAKIGDLHVLSGLPPGAGATFRARNRMGEQRAKLLLYSGSRLTGREAVEAGLAVQCVPRAELHNQVNAIVEQFKRAPRNAIAVTKAGFVKTDGLANESAWKVELEVFKDFILHDPMASEGFRSFTEGRKPAWL